MKEASLYPRHRRLSSIFELIGPKADNITCSVGWALAHAQRSAVPSNSEEFITLGAWWSGRTSTKRSQAARRARPYRISGSTRRTNPPGEESQKWAERSAERPRVGYGRSSTHLKDLGKWEEDKRANEPGGANKYLSI